MIFEITSKDNLHIKRAKKILDSSKFRKQERCFLVEGVRMCEEAFKSGNKITEVFYTEKCFEKFSDIVSKISKISEKSFVINEKISKLISDTDTPQGIFCICKLPENTMFDMNNSDRVVLLENIQNPSNLGSILRTCDALGIKTVAVSQGSCDVYNSKVLRGSMGAVFRLNICFFENTAKFIRELQEEKGFKIYATVPHDDSLILGTTDFKGKCGIILGNEGNGLTQDAIDECFGKITIPMNKQSESLNVSVAAGISIWEMINRGGNLYG